MPFESILQLNNLAGDNACPRTNGKSSLIATPFHRNTLATMKGGTEMKSLGVAAV